MTAIWRAELITAGAYAGTGHLTYEEAIEGLRRLIRCHVRASTLPVMYGRLRHIVQADRC